MNFCEKKLIRLAILLTLTLSITAGAYLVYRVWDYWSADQTYAGLERDAVQKVKVAGASDGLNELRTLTESPGTRDEDEKRAGSEDRDRTNADRRRGDEECSVQETIGGIGIPDKPVIDWEELSKSGRDIVAWLDIPALGIAYPVVQGDDNAFYLHHLPNGEYKNAGSLFMEAANSPDLTDINTVIYGHNMDNGSMFGKFRSMTAEDCSPQPFLWLCTKKKARLYKMLSIHISKVDDESYTLFERAGSTARDESSTAFERVVSTGTADDTAAGSSSWMTDGNVYRWIVNENQRSYIPMPLPASDLGRIVTLSTCASLSDERRVLQAILIREFEP